MRKAFFFQEYLGVFSIWFVSFFITYTLNATSPTESDIRSFISIVATDHNKGWLRRHIYNFDPGYGGHMSVDPTTLAHPPLSRSYFNTTKIAQVNGVIEFALLESMKNPKPPYVKFLYDDADPSWQGSIKIDCDYTSQMKPGEHMGFGGDGSPTNVLRICLQGFDKTGPARFGTAYPVSRSRSLFKP